MENKTIIILDGLRGNEVANHTSLQKMIIENIDIFTGIWRSIWVIIILILVYVIVREFIRNKKRGNKRSNNGNKDMKKEKIEGKKIE
ncbi:MAG: hypothetical protein KC550_01415 [Nanoarchaeota archaeon]|nr:hypothetical protein [Nanoarchaeota archaeon]